MEWENNSVKFLAIAGFFLSLSTRFAARDRIRSGLLCDTMRIAREGRGVNPMRSAEISPDGGIGRRVGLKHQ